MSLLILSFMLVSAVALSRAILGEMQMTVNTKNSITAFYAADSAIEKSLYYIKFSRKYGDSEPLNALEGQTFNIDGGQTFNFLYVSTTAPSFSFDNISNSNPAHIDIIYPGGDIINPIDWDISGDTDHIYELRWTINNCDPNHASDKLEITEYSFTNPIADFGIDKYIAVCNCAGSDVCDPDLTRGTIKDDRFYRFIFRPLDGLVSSMSFEVYNHVPELVNIASKIIITAEGKYRNSGYILEAEVPGLASVSDIFSYVIFSEEELKKEL